MRILVVAAAVLASAAAPVSAREGCTRPSGHHIGACRFGVHGTPDLSRALWSARRHRDVSVSVRVDSLAPGRWPLRDSLGGEMGALSFDRGRFEVTTSDGRALGASSVRVRGRGCTADPTAQRRSALVQVHAPGSSSGGTQAFLDLAALDTSSASGRAARAAFDAQRNPGCGPGGRPAGRVRMLGDPAVGAVAHARLSSGAINDVREYDAKPDFGRELYFMTNTTSVSVGGIARGVVPVGVPVRTVDRFRGCDPGSDGTLTWRYVVILGPRRMYGWVPGRCR